MGKFRFFRKRLETKENPTQQTVLIMLGGNPLWTKNDFRTLAEGGYKQFWTVYACVNLITESAAMVPWKLFRKPASQDGKKEEIKNHPLLDLLMRPNPQDGGAAFTKNVLAYYLIGGNSYLIKVGPNEGPPKELYTMRPDRVRILPGDQFEPIAGYRYSVGGIPRKPDFKFNEVLHLKTFNPLDDWYGLSPLEVAAKEIDIGSMGRDWNMTLMQNEGKLPGAITTDGAMEPDQRIEIKKMFREDHQGYKNVGNPLVLEGGLKWEPFAISPKDMDWLKSDVLTTRKICSVLKTAPELIGDSANKTYSNVQEARKGLYTEAVIPLLCYLKDEYNNWLTPAWGDDRLVLEIDEGSILAIKDELTAVVERTEKAWWMKVNEKREATGLGSIGEVGEVILVPGNMTPLSDISGNISEE